LSALSEIEISDGTNGVKNRTAILLSAVYKQSYMECCLSSEKFINNSSAGCDVNG